MVNKIKITAHGDTAIVDIEGEIGIPTKEQYADNKDLDRISSKFRDSINAILEISTPKVVVNIRSTGGDIDDALIVYDTLRAISRRCKITTRCFGYCASAASVIAQAASKGHREISKSSLYLIHRCTTSVVGTAIDMEYMRKILDEHDVRLARIYANHTDKNSAESFLDLMSFNQGHGRWLNPDETISVGLADKLIEEEEIDIYNDCVPLWERVKKKIGL